MGFRAKRAKIARPTEKRLNSTFLWMGLEKKEGQFDVCKVERWLFCLNKFALGGTSYIILHISGAHILVDGSVL